MRDLPRPSRGMSNISIKIHEAKLTERMVTVDTQYTKDVFRKLNYPLKRGNTILDVGCGDGSDGRFFETIYGLKWRGIDTHRNAAVKTAGSKFTTGSIFQIPFNDNTFDYVFTHDVIHHIDEHHQRKQKHFAGLKELRRVCKRGGTIIIVEANRYNPLFYPHMVKMLGHNHLRQSYFKKLIHDSYQTDLIQFRFFEAHFYPPLLVQFFRIYEFIMEHIMPKEFIAYNAAIIKKRNT